MRMRKKKHGEERLAKCRELLYEHVGDEPLTTPTAVFGKSEGEVYLEIGAGKGGFACGMVEKHPDVSYFAMERVTDCVVLAAERASGAGLGDNLRFMIDSADRLMGIFAPGTVDKIFLNFSDPWSKKGYAKRRLTHKRYLAVYLTLLKEGGTLTFKTDNVGLFDFTLEQIEEIGLTPTALTRDLHASEWNEGNVVTEYEANFSSQGVKINMVRIERPKGCDYTAEIPYELTLEGVKEPKRFLEREK